MMRPVRRPAPILVLFTRAPRWGTVKRRLAARVGDAAALRFHRAQVERLGRTLRDPRWRLVLAVTPDSARGPWTGGHPVIGQGRGDLGARMARCLQKGPVVLIGSDIPGITRAHIARAFALLRGADVVFGPAEDGGFWLVGVAGRRAVPDLFAGARWSTADTLDTCRTPLLAHGYRLAQAETLADVD